MLDFSPPVPPLDIVYADHTIAIVDKASGLLSCPGRGPDKQDSVQTRIPSMFRDAQGSLLAHRLDQATSGLMVVGLTPMAHRQLQQQFENREVEKEYEAILDGWVATDEGRIELPFRVDVERRPHQIYDPVHGKMGVTQWRVLHRDPEARKTRVRFWPKTGRTHQLRVHAAHSLGLGCPIAGDALYGDAQSAPRLLLHACRLVFNHPSDARKMDFASKVPF